MNGIMHVVPDLSVIPSTRPRQGRSKTRSGRSKSWPATWTSSTRAARSSAARSCSSCAPAASATRSAATAGALGPDLSELPKKLDGQASRKLDVLREVIEPAGGVDKKYQLVGFELISGQTVQGIIVTAYLAAPASRM